MELRFVFYTLLVLINSWELQRAVGEGGCRAEWSVTLESRNFTVHWKGEELEGEVVVQVTPPEEVERGCPALRLKVPFSAKAAHTGDVCANTDYSVVVSLLCSNGLNQTKGSLHWRLEQELSSPTNLSASEVTNTSASITWDPPHHPVLLFEVIKSRIDGPEEIYQVGTPSYLLAGLVAFTRYYVKVRARTEVALGPWSHALELRTLVGVPFAPLRLRTTSATNSTLTVSWEEPQPSTGPVLYYTVQWQKKNGTGQSFSTSDTTHALERLSPHTNYLLRVRATTEAGDGAWSAYLDTWTAIGVPSEPRNVTALNVTSTSIIVGWEEPDPSNGPLLSYVVSWGARGGAVSQALVSDREFEAQGLSPYTRYSFQVSARTEAGVGPDSERITVRTDIDVPSAPRNLTALEVRNTSAALAWDPPQFPNGPLLGYVVRSTSPPHFDDAWTNDTSVVLQGLNSSTDYLLHVVALTSAGEGAESENISIQTLLGVPAALENVTASLVTPTHIRINWSPNQQPWSRTDHVVIAWGVVGTTPSSLSTTETGYDALGLRPYTEYFFQVDPRNEAGPGPATTLKLRTKIAVPSLPRDVSVIETSDSSALLRWLPPEHPNAPQISYSIQWESSSNGSEAEGWSPETTFLVEGLDPSTQYSVRVAGNNSAGRGPWSMELMLDTKDKEPLKRSTLVLAISLGIAIPLVVIFILVAIFLARRKGVFKQSGPRKPPPMIQERQPTGAPTSVVEMNVIHQTSTSMTVHNFEERMKLKSRQEFSTEFEELRKQSVLKPCNEAKLEANLVKNRWVKMLPYDFSRVKLYPSEGELRPTYINASYMPGANHLTEYVATQGPLPNTVEDLWRLVWQQGVPLMVMLTQCVERAVRNCEQYWPSAGQSRAYGDVHVQNVSESILTSYVQRTFAMQHRSQKRHVVQMHFTNWPVSGCPRSPDEFLHFGRKVREMVSERRPGPLLVHCSAGVGRTGTFIAVDRLQQSLQQSDEIDVFETVLDMRKYRPHMVHTEEQYVFIYKCIERLLQERNTTEENIYEQICQ